MAEEQWNLESFRLDDGWAAEKSEHERELRRR
jgi:hypothetical protein